MSQEFSVNGPAGICVVLIPISKGLTSEGSVNMIRKVFADIAVVEEENLAQLGHNPSQDTSNKPQLF